MRRTGLAAERWLLDEARASLASGDAASALSTLDRYARQRAEAFGPQGDISFDMTLAAGALDGSVSVPAATRSCTPCT